MLVYFGLNLSSFYTLLWFSVSVIRCCWLEGYNPNRPRICSPKQPVQINARPGKWGLGTVQKNHPGSPEVTFLGTDTSFAQSHPTLLKKYLIEGNCGLTNGRAANWTPEVAFNLFWALFRRQLKFPHRVQRSFVWINELLTLKNVYTCRLAR